ncbi:MOSC N-terminal beta barrel domain-containing protein [Myxococcota bacterium]|nr:MOSC N-terminal beta barrel domain-containing protein [Myxococcota bacterium]
MTAGAIHSIHRYPVKSMLGENLESAQIGDSGLLGDRAWALRDETRGSIVGAKKIPELMGCTARYLEEPGPGQAPAAQIHLPDGSTFMSDSTDAGSHVSRVLGQSLTVWPLLPAEESDHYRRRQAESSDFESELRTVFAREATEPLPDMAAFPPELFEYESPPGTYFDAFPLLVLSKRSLETVQAADPERVFDVRRFRPNLLLDVPDSGDSFPEVNWVGRRVRFGQAVLEISMACPRCVMTTHGFADLPKEPGIMRTLVKYAGGNLGVYASVLEPGEVRIGDSVEILGS